MDTFAKVANPRTTTGLVIVIFETMHPIIERERESGCQSCIPIRGLGHIYIHGRNPWRTLLIFRKEVVFKIINVKNKEYKKKMQYKRLSTAILETSRLVPVPRF